MATKTNETEAEQTREEGGDGPLMDVTSAAVKKMLTKAKERGYVTYDELNQVLPQDQVSSEQIEDTMSMLSEMGISVIESEEQEEQGERAPAEADEEDSSRAGNIDDEDIGRTDDPVRMYLREMGSVELLSREGEIAIAKRIEAGREKMIGGICESPLTIKALLSWREALKDGQILLRDIIDLDATYGGTPDGAAASGAAPEGAMARGTADQRLSQGASATDPIAKRQAESGSTGEQAVATNGSGEAAAQAEQPSAEGQQTNGEDKSEQQAAAGESDSAGESEGDEEQRATFARIEDHFGPVLREGLVNDFEQKEALTKLLRYRSTWTERQEQAEDALPVDYQGESLQIGFNVGYLVDVMNALDEDQVKITLSNPNSSALIEASNDNRCLYVVMPMRL